jgi:predicted nucleic acid-binding protein
VSGALLDTSILIAGGERSWSGLPPSAAISVLTLGELHAGVRLAGARRVAAVRERRLAAVRAAFAALPVDEPVAERYGDLLALARAQRRTVKASDLLIIATAAATDRELYTLDVAQSRLAQAAGLAATAL